MAHPLANTEETPMEKSMRLAGELSAALNEYSDGKASLLVRPSNLGAWAVTVLMDPIKEGEKPVDFPL